MLVSSQKRALDRLMSITEIRRRVVNCAGDNCSPGTFRYLIEEVSLWVTDDYRAIGLAKWLVAAYIADTRTEVQEQFSDALYGHGQGERWRTLPVVIVLDRATWACNTGFRCQSMQWTRWHILHEWDSKMVSPFYSDSRYDRFAMRADDVIQLAREGYKAVGELYDRILSSGAGSINKKPQ